MTEREVFFLVDLSLRWSVAVLFAASGLHKLLRSHSFSAVLDGYGVSGERLRRVATPAVPAVELGVAALWPVPVLSGLAAVSTVALLTIFSAAMFMARRRGYQDDCGCGGVIARGTIGAAAYCRNLVIGGISVGLAVAGDSVGAVAPAAIMTAALLAFFLVSAFAQISALLELRTATRPFRPPSGDSESLEASVA